MFNILDNKEISIFIKFNEIIDVLILIEDLNLFIILNNSKILGNIIKLLIFQITYLILYQFFQSMKLVKSLKIIELVFGQQFSSPLVQ